MARATRGVCAQSIHQARRRSQCLGPAERGDMAKLEPRWAVGIFLGRTDESDEEIVGTAAGSSLRGRVGDARRTRSGSVMRSRHSSVCPGIPRDWRWRLRWQAADHDTSQSPSSSSTARRQAVQRAWESLRNTQRSVERGFEKLINPNATDVIPAKATITEEDNQPVGSAALAEQQQQAAQPGTGQPVQTASRTKRGIENSSAPSSAKRAHTPPRLSRTSR